TRIVPITNAFVRTISLNSRLTTDHVLYMHHLLHQPGRGLDADTLQEDLLEGRLHALEAPDRQPRVDDVAQEVLRRRVRADAHLGDVPVLADLRDHRRGAQVRHRLRRPLLQRDRDVFATVPALDIGDRAVDDLLTPREDADVVADPLGLLDHVRAEDDRPTLPLEIEDDLLE